MTVKMAVFASGNGSNAENLARYFAAGTTARVSLIVTNRRQAFVLERAGRLGVPAVYISKEEWGDGNRVLEVLRGHGIRFIVLAGFLLRVPPLLLQAYPQRIVNIHPSLLPKHGGKGMYGDRVHEAVVAAGDSESGITIHYVNERYDEGAPIAQFRCPVLPGDTAADVAAKVHALEYEHYPQVVEQLLKDTVNASRSLRNG